MNLRVFKKDIEYFVGEFIDDCALFVALNPHKDADEIAQIIDEAVDLYNDLKNKSNHPEGNKKAYSLFCPSSKKSGLVHRVCLRYAFAILRLQTTMYAPCQLLQFSL